MNNSDPTSGKGLNKKLPPKVTQVHEDFFLFSWLIMFQSFNLRFSKQKRNRTSLYFRKYYSVFKRSGFEMATSSFLDPDPKLLQLQKHFCRFLIWDVQFFMMHVFFIICLS